MQAIGGGRIGWRSLWAAARRKGWRLGGRREAQRGFPEALLDIGEMERALLREKARAERSGRSFALVVFAPHGSGSRGELPVAARVLLERARQSDLVGRKDAERLAALLPETPPDSAWAFGEDTLELLAREGLDFECEVYGYPPSADQFIDDPTAPAARQPQVDFTVSNGNGNGGGNDPASGSTRKGHPRPARRVKPRREESRVRSSRTVQGLSSAFFRPLPRWKRAMDIAGSLVLLALTVVPGLLIALAIRLTSPGPAIFTQYRAGLGGKPFLFYKFRSMEVGADQLKASLRPQDERRGPTTKIPGDPRVTALGRWLRAFSLDELPQLWNVLKGDMSLVGPRPPTLDEVAQYEPWQLERLRVTGGMTGSWQVGGRSQIPFLDWVRMDIRYARTRSLLTDLILLAKTPLAVLRRTGAS